MSIPIASLGEPIVAEDRTKATVKPSLARLLDEEDLRRARAALATALDPQGNGAFVAWENPESGSKGTFTPSGGAFPAEAKICRNFHGEIARGGDTKSVQGTACQDKTGEWTIAAIDSLKKS